jgi:hypothetical protein
MGEYKFSVYAKWQLCLGISYEYGQVLIRLPFVTMHISLSKNAEGVEIFGKIID